MNLISCEDIVTPRRLKCKIRYKQKEATAIVYQHGAELHIEFDEPQRAISQGQAVVLYDGDIVVGGGTIKGL